MTIADDIEALVNRKRRLPIRVWAIIALTCAALVYGSVATNTPPSGEPMLVPSTGEITEAPVTDCDKYAASDNDPQRKETGVPLGKINPDLAVPACEAAVRQYPNSTRLSLQLGRAYQKANYFTAAVGQYRKAAEQNYAPAQNNLGASYENGRGVPKDDQQAIAWYRKAAEQNYAPAQSNLGVMYQNGQGVRKDDQQAIAWYRKAAEQNYAPAQSNLGVMYQNGQGVRKDDQQAIAWYRKAAEQNYAPAQSNLGVMYQNGQGVPRDDEQAIAWYRKAAEQNYAPAQNNLGFMYQYGQGVRKDDQQAIAWYRKAAEQNYALAQNNLGVMYQYGQGVRKDEQQAIAWYRKAADQGLALALNNLDEDAEAAVNRNDFATAIRIMRPLADQGHARAQRLLGMMYNAGWGVPNDDAEAVKWFRRAANQGDGDAQASLGAEYRDGTGVPQDYVHAYMWFILAAQTEEPGVNITAQNIGLLAAQRQAYNIDGTRPTELKPWQVSILKGARAFNCPEGPGRDRCVKVYGYLINLDALALRMTPAQIAEAQKLANEWKPTTQPPR
jgi:TPR repeat protein